MSARVGTLLRRTFLATAALAAAAVLLLAAVGWRPVVLVTGSMAPTAPAGAVVVAAPTPAAQVAAGDVVTVRWQGAAAPVTHRVVAVERDASGQRWATTKGDANEGPDVQRTPLDGDVLVARAVLPRAGRLLVAGPTDARLAAGLGLVAVGLLGLAGVWWPRGQGPRQPA